MISKRPTQTSAQPDLPTTVCRPVNSVSRPAIRCQHQTGPIAVRVAALLVISALFGAALASTASRLYPVKVVNHNLGDFRAWHPTADEIAAKLGAGAAGSYRDSRHRQFALLFQHRFRTNEAGVGLKFLSNERLQVACVAAMPRDGMARVAAAAHLEARAIFGRDFTIDLCETTGQGNSKIGEGRADASTGKFAVRFGPEFEKPRRPLTSDQVVEAQHRDFMRPVNNPKTVPASAADIRPDSRVFSLTSGAVARAYSLNLMKNHELVNDTLGRLAAVITWCSRCRTAIAYDRRIAGRLLTFGISGQLWHNAMVMYDKETDSRWSQVTGEAISGPLKGTKLRMLAGTPQVTWSLWRGLNVRGEAMSIFGQEDAEPEGGPRRFVSTGAAGLITIAHPDQRARMDEMVLGVALNGASKAYILDSFPASGMAADYLGERPVLVWYDRTSGASGVYDRPANEEFRVEGGDIVSERGRWQAATGRSLSGGRDLRAIPHTQAYWFAWSAFHPRTLLSTSA